MIVQLITETKEAPADIDVPNSFHNISFHLNFIVSLIVVPEQLHESMPSKFNVTTKLSFFNEIAANASISRRACRRSARV